MQSRRGELPWLRGVAEGRGSGSGEGTDHRLYNYI